jgi:hypothetical protein
LTVAAGFENHGLIELSNFVACGCATQLVVTTGTLINAPDGTIRAGTGGSGRTLTAQLDNRGTLEVQISLLITKASAAHVNAGTIAVTGGNLTISGPVTSIRNAGTWTVSPGRILDVTGGTFEQTDGALLTGGGELRLLGVVLAMNGDASTVALGALRITNGSATEVNADNFAAITADGTTLTFIGDVSTARTTLNVARSTLNGAGSLMNTAGMRLPLTRSTVNLPVANAGVLEALGAVNLTRSFTTTPTSVVRLGANTGTGETGPLTVAAGFENHGLIELSNFVACGCATQLVVTTGTLINAPDGTIQAGTGGSGRTLTAQLDNRGTLELYTRLLIAADVASSGRVEVRTSTPRILTIDGFFSTTGTVLVDLGAAAPSALPLVEVTRRATLAGVLSIEAPTPGAVSAGIYRLLTASGCTGTPCVAPVSGTFSPLQLPPGLTASIAYDFSGAFLRVF